MLLEPLSRLPFSIDNIKLGELSLLALYWVLMTPTIIIARDINTWDWIGL